MQKKKIIIYLLIIPILVACSSNAVQTVEVTRLVPQAMEVTRIIPQPIATSGSGTLVTDSPSITIQTDSISVPLDPSYFDGLIVLTQFYTLLDHGLFEEAVSLFSLSKQNINGVEADIAYYESSTESVKIRFIIPYDYWLAKQGIEPPPSRKNEIRYVIGKTVIYKGAAWNDNGTPVPHNETRFISLVLENGQWKIDEMNSSPFVSQP
jgi:hypothetical protein